MYSQQDRVSSSDMRSLYALHFQSQIVIRMPLSHTDINPDTRRARDNKDTSSYANAFRIYEPT